MIKEFAPFRDKFGLISPSGQPSQNGVCFTVEYLIALWHQSPLLEFVEERRRVAAVLTSCLDARGYLHRHPESTERDSMDNYGAALVFAALWNWPGFAARSIDLGKTPIDGVDESDDAARNKKYWPWYRLLGGGVWNSVAPTKFSFFSWLGRSPGFMGLMDLAANRRTTLFREFALWVGQMHCITRPVSDQDAWRLAYINWQFLRRLGPIWALSYRLWGWALLKKHPDGMQNVYRYYFGEGFPLWKFAQRK